MRSALLFKRTAKSIYITVFLMSVHLLGGQPLTKTTLTTIHLQLPFLFPSPSLFSRSPFPPEDERVLFFPEKSQTLSIRAPSEWLSVEAV